MDSNADLDGRRVVITGGGSGSGLATARRVVAAGGAVVLAGRSRDKLTAAADELGGDVTTAALDVTDEAAVDDFFTRLGPIDHLVTAAAGAAVGRVVDLPTAAARDLMDSKYWGQYHAVKYASPHVHPEGSITLFSGWMSRKPMVGTSSFAAVDGAVEALTRILALELAPVRVNAVAPGLLDLTGGDQDHDAPPLRPFAQALPGGRVGTPDDIARAVVYLMTGTFTTGAVLDVDGGQGAGLTVPGVEQLVSGST